MFADLSGLIASSPEIAVAAALGAGVMKIIDKLVEMASGKADRTEVLEVKIDNLNQTCRDGFDRMVKVLEKSN